MSNSKGAINSRPTARYKDNSASRTCIDAYPISVQPYLSTYITSVRVRFDSLVRRVTRTGESFDTQRRNTSYLSRTKRCINTMPETRLFWIQSEVHHLEMPPNIDFSSISTAVDSRAARAQRREQEKSRKEKEAERLGKCTVMFGGQS